MTKDDYIKAYEQLTERAIEAADKHYDTLGVPMEKRDYGEWICEEEVYSTTDEVVGYYLEAYPHDYFPVWLDNITGIALKKQDIEVSAILNNLWDEQYGNYDLDLYKGIECCIDHRRCKDCPYKVYESHCCRSLLIKDAAHHFGRWMCEAKDEKAMAEQWSGELNKGGNDQ